ncbi:tail fiber domain-containing protein, partial [Paludibacter sp. 221]|uniref:tail fiber domain-containing protein n=1 Tax=Paludibacter sp. 221 TaxID=2302939 RepID=UPI0013D896DB
WALGTDNNTNTTYTSSASITLSGTEFQRAALTGDVTATANNNATTVARIRGRNVSTTAPTTGQVLKFDGTSWAPATDAQGITAVTGSGGVTATTASGSTALSITDLGVSTAKLADKSVTAAKLNQMGATDGQVMKWNNTNRVWEPAAVWLVGGNSTASVDVSIIGSQNNSLRFLADGRDAGIITYNTVALGPNSGTNFSMGVAIGGAALRQATGYSYSVAIGSSALTHCTTGTNNVAVGYGAMGGNPITPLVITGTKNVSIGSQAGRDITTGNKNICIGAGAAASLTTGSSNIVIGEYDDIYAPTTDKDYQLIVGKWIRGAKSSTAHNSYQIAINNTSLVRADYAFYVNTGANAYIGGSAGWTQNSDRRLKENIRSIGYGLPQVMKLNPVSFTMKESGNKHIGFIAQEVRDIIPEIVNGTEGDIEKGEVLGVSYAEFAPVLVKAIQEQQKIIEELTRRIEMLEKK